MSATLAGSVVVVDNYDSFTYNLVQYLGELGARVAVVRNDAMSAGELAACGARAFVLSPGPCTPAQAGVTVELVRRCGAEIPVLGVCLGHQAIAVAYGGEVVRAPRVMHGKVSAVRHTGGGVLAGLPTPFSATRYHSLAVDPVTLPAALEVTATSDDGVIMAMRHRRHPVEGVQFHPESIATEHGHRMLATFLRGAGVETAEAVG